MIKFEKKQMRGYIILDWRVQLKRKINFTKEKNHKKTKLKKN